MVLMLWPSIGSSTGVKHQLLHLSRLLINGVRRQGTTWKPKIRLLCYWCLTRLQTSGLGLVKRKMELLILQYAGCSECSKTTLFGASFFPRSPAQSHYYHHERWKALVDLMQDYLKFLNLFLLFS